jgi:hypothetical protein
MFEMNATEKMFWTWFSNNASKYLNLEQDQQQLLDQLSQYLSKIHPDLTFEIGPKVKDKRDLIISAGGIKEAFPYVEKLVSEAPHIPHWNIIAFRQRQSLDFILNLDGYSLSPDQMWYTLTPDNNKVGLHLYIEGLNDENADAMAAASYIILDNALGEYDVETKLGFIERLPIMNKDEAKKRRLKPIHKLAHDVDMLFRASARLDS